MSTPFLIARRIALRASRWETGRVGYRGLGSVVVAGSIASSTGKNDSFWSRNG